MKKCMKTANGGLAVLLSLVMAAGMAVNADAAQASDLDLGQSGSVSLTLADSDGNTVSGGAVTLYEVAGLYLDDGNMAYRKTDAFSAYTGTLDVEGTALAEMAEGLAEYTVGNAVAGTTASVGDSGEVTFDGLELGLYLVVQTEESDNYETVNPFVVTVPIEEDGVWIYAVDASPKVGAVTPTEPDTPDTPSTTTTTTTTTMTSTPSTGLTSTLPQTGQLNWPIPVLAIAGAVLLAAGWALNRSGQKKTHYAP